MLEPPCKDANIVLLLIVGRDSKDRRISSARRSERRRQAAGAKIAEDRGAHPALLRRIFLPVGSVLRRTRGFTHASAKSSS